jgi:ankyrin repeat protein
MESPESFLDAVKKGDAETVEALLRAEPALSGARMPNGSSAILLAVYCGRSTLVEVFERHGAALDLFEACAAGRASLVTDWLRRDPGLVNAYAPDGFTPLGLACFFGHADIAGILLDSGADVNQRAGNPTRVAPVHSAAAGRHAAIVRLLLDRGADPNARQDAGFAPLHSAAANNDRETALLLADRGADVRVKADNGKTPGDFARERGHADMANWLDAF